MATRMVATAERDLIMRTAYELIQRDGSKETSVHDVLREAGLSTRAFYRHFRSKDELVLEMYRVDCDRVTALLDAAVSAAPTPLAALEAWIDQSLAVVYDARRLRHAVVLSSAEVASADGFTDPETDAIAIQAVVGAHMRARLDRDHALTRSDARAHILDLFRRALGA